MKKISIRELNRLFHAEKLDEKQIAYLRLDERKGVQQLIHKYDKQQLKFQALQERYVEMTIFERSHYKRGIKYIAGVDEAGRGPLAGPVVAAAVILPSNFRLLGLDDSKRLTESKRNEFFYYIKEHAISYGISIVDSKIIDQINILEATKLAMAEAIEKLDPMPERILIDAVELPKLTISSEAITKGDAKSISIAAASVLAKVTRDNYMKELHLQFPMYEFAFNKGYGTEEHVKKIHQYGVCPQHRCSFAPVKKMIN
ncbi:MULTISPECIES: ribonuclease HII [Virgibacillus]|uniref:Ribonuclease HII n=1 Tax=Virgibacillus dokdonensis TaxID=302167 RepID=A0A2K9J425_9BACI|nr:MULTISPECIES: ribonuclease HII [Virgibacillus]AUJ26699.1 Ribonuclease HII [Virgibacillus dokdonensis]NWO12953.1 ribonuclease HII [Virgibacillus sp.]